jgi:DNA-binding CsgD family transcriptional regulator
MAVSPDRLREALNRLAHRGADVHDFSLAAAHTLARAVPFDGVCVITMDPATLLPTSEVVENGLPPKAAARMAEIEISGADVNTFAGLARSGQGAAALSTATGGDLDRSLRHRELKRPHGLGDELRAVLASDSATWGGLTLLRASGSRHFAPADVALVAAMSRQFAEGLRRAILLTATLPAGRPDDSLQTGIAVLAPDNTITSANEAARMWLAELLEGSPGEALPPAVTAVASRARSIVAGQAETASMARARVRAASGQWLLVHGSALGDGPGAPTAVILEPARPHELAPLIADAYGLSDRERAVTQYVAQGHSTAAIASLLHISPWTVQDHLKSIFEKTGTGSRGELIAAVFFNHYAPQLADGAPIGPDGGFALAL